MENRDLSFNFPDSLKELAKYELLADELTKVNNLTGPYYMQELLKAIELSSKLYTGALYKYELAIVQSKAIRAYLMLDEASSALTAKSLRINEENMKAFAESDARFLASKEEEAYYCAMSTHLNQKHEKFKRAHDDAKEVFRTNRNPHGSATSMPSTGDT